jgi:TP901 family phage tail tape measure protein
MANRTVVVDLIVNTARWTAGFQKASHDMASATTNAETKTRALQQQVGLLGVGMTAFAAMAVRSWARFDQAMARVEATGGGAAERIKDLTNAAKSDTVTELGYSAVEAADAIYELTKAGVEANAIIAGGLNGALSLAAAESMDAAEAATIMASALGQFNLEGEQSAHVADLITAAAGKAQGSAHDLGFALKQSGLVANQFGLSIEETTGTLGLFANAGLIGSDAGTSLRTMLLHLVGPSGKAAETMEEIGFSAYGANGQLVNMETLANRLQVALKDESEQARNAALATIFGADATRAASLLYREGGDAVAEWTAKVNDAGYAQEVARKRMDNLNGDLKILSSTWDKFLIGVGESADAPLRGLVQGLTAVVDAFADLPPAAQGIIMALAGGGGLGTLGVLAIGQVMSALNSLQTGLVNTGRVGEVAATRITNGMKVATIATGALGAAATIGFALWATAAAEAEAAVDAYVATLNEAAETTDSTVEHIANVLTQGQDLGWNDFFGNYDLIANAEKMGVAVEDLAGYILGEADAMERVNAATKEYQGDSFSWGSSQRMVDVMNFTGALDDQKGVLGEAKKEKELQAQVNEKLAGTEGEAADGMDELGNAAAEAESAMEEQTKAIQENIEAWQELAGIHMDADESIANYEQAVDDANEAIKAAQTDTEKYSELLGENRDALDLNTQAGRDAQDALQAISKAAHDQMQAQYDAGASTEELTAQMQAARRQFVEAAMAAGLTRDAARKLADSYGLIPDNVSTNLSARDNASGTIKSIRQQLAELRDQTIYITTVRRNATEKAKNGKSYYAGYASGGALYGGTAGVDSIPILGMPGEHMLTTKDVQAMGGQDAVYAFRRGLHSKTDGLMRMARGGAVPRGGALKGHSLAFWQSKLLTRLEQLNLQQQIGGLNRDLRAKGDDKLGPLARQIAREELRQARLDLYFGNYARKLGSERDFARWINQAERDAEKKSARRETSRAKSEARQDFRKSLIRGETKDSLTSGLDGVYSVTDNAQGMIDSGIFDGSRNASRLQDAIQKANSSARSLYGSLDKIASKLEDARAKAAELHQIQDQVASGITSGFGLGDIKGPVNPWSGEQGPASGKQLLAGAQDYAKKTRALAEKLVLLQKKGFSGVILQEIAGMGVEAGVAAADSLLALSATDVTAFNSAYRSIDTWAERAGAAVTGGFFKGGVAAADGIVKGLESEQAKVEKAIEKMALAMQDALKRALGIKSPSRVFTALMTPVGDGAVLGLERQMPRVSAAAANLINVGRFGAPEARYGNTAGVYSAGSATSTLPNKSIHIEVTSNNAVAEKDSVIVNRTLQSVAALGEL